MRRTSPYEIDRVRPLPASIVKCEPPVRACVEVDPDLLSDPTRCGVTIRRRSAPGSWPPGAARPSTHDAGFPRVVDAATSRSGVGATRRRDVAQRCLGSADADQECRGRSGGSHRSRPREASGYPRREVRSARAGRATSTD